MDCENLVKRLSLLLLFPILISGALWGQSPGIKTQKDKRNRQNIYTLQLLQGQELDGKDLQNMEVFRNKEGVKSLEYRAFDKTFIITTELKLPSKDIFFFFEALGLNPEWEK